jgi:hypothetical protein
MRAGVSLVTRSNSTQFTHTGEGYLTTRAESGKILGVTDERILP